MVRCAASWCEVSSTESSAKFFKFPDEEDSRVDAWKDFAEIEGETAGLVLCSDHFAPCYLNDDGNITDIAIPTVWKKAADADSTEVVPMETPEKVVFRVKPASSKERDILSRATYLSDLLTTSNASSHKGAKIKRNPGSKITVSKPVMPIIPGSANIKGPPKFSQTLLGPRIIGGTKPRIVKLNPDNVQLMNKVKQTIHGAVNTSTPKEPATKARDTSLLGEFLTFGKPREQKETIAERGPDPTNDDEIVEDDEYDLVQDAEKEEVIEEIDETPEIDSTNLTDHEKAVRPPAKPLLAGAEKSASKSPAPSSTISKSNLTSSRAVKLPSAATLVKVKSSVDMPSYVSMTPVTKGKSADSGPVKIRVRGSNQLPDDLPCADPKVTPRKVELNIKPVDDVSKLTADLVLTPDVPRGAKNTFQNTIELKAREEGRLLLTRISSDHISHRDVSIPALPFPIEVMVQPSILRSLAGKRLVKNPVVNFWPVQACPSPFTPENQRSVYASQITVSDSGLMSIRYSARPITDQKEKTPTKKTTPVTTPSKSPGKRGRKRKKVQKEEEETEEDEDEIDLYDDDDANDTPLHFPQSPVDTTSEITIQVPSQNGVMNVEGPVVDVMKRKLKDYLKSNPNTTTVVIIPADHSSIPGGANLEKSLSEDEEENDSVVKSEEERRQLRRSLSAAMRCPKRPFPISFGTPLFTSAMCKRQIKNEMMAFSSSLSKVASR